MLRRPIFCILSALVFLGSSVQAAECALITVQKSGTHLVMHLISKLVGLQPTRRPDHARLPQFYMSIHFGDKQLVDAVFANPNLPVIACVRDLRDVSVSMRDWYKKRESAPFVITEGIDRDLWLTLPKEERLTALFQPEIWGISFLLRACNQVTSRLEQLKQPNVYVTSFEKLVGAKGGGSDVLQLQEVKNIASHLGVFLTDKEAKAIAHDLFGNSATFHKGQIGRWKKNFSQEQLNLAEPYIRDLNETLGYTW